uniref:Shieldin complex subunit 2 n=1 Tax=Sinocyclocheilus grahami TaxID=75366 RepID=A0A672SI19_SINGR
MAHKPKIHVFLGAPCPQALAEDVQERAAPPWKTIDLTWSQGKLIPKDIIREAQTDECVVMVSGRMQTAVTSDRVSENTEDKTETSQDDGTPSGSQCSQSKAESVEEDELCPVLVTEYLDSCFCSHSLSRQGRDGRPTSPVSTETEYLSTWTKSQALLLRGRVAQCPTSDFPDDFLLGSPHTPPKQTPSSSISSPELYSPVVSPEERGLGGTLQSSEEWHNESLSQRQQERGVILEITTDGILCSQGNAMAEKPVGHEEVGARTIAAPLCGLTTLLARCKTHGVRYNILVAVVHPCHLKEVKVKTGASAGTSVPLATLIVTDQSDVEMKVVLWRTAAFWALTFFPGEILLITDVTVHIDKWKTETVLQSSFTSKLLNLGQVTRERIPPDNTNIITTEA